MRLIDIVVIERDAKTLLLALDQEGRSVFSHELTAASPARIGPGDFAPFFSSPLWRRPTGLAYRAGKLYVSDREAQAVFEVDIATGGMKEVLGRPHVLKPASVAVSDDGVVAVGDDHFDDIVLVAPGTEPKKLGRKLDDPDRLSFVGRDLIALETEEGIISIVSDAPARGRAQEVATVNNLLRGVGTDGDKKLDFIRGVAASDESSRIRDFAVRNGVYYVADRGRVMVFTPNSSYKSFPVFQKEQAGAAPSRIAVSSDYLLVMEVDGGGVFKLPRPVPVSVSFGVNVHVSSREMLNQQHLALASLYEYLNARGLLHHRTVAARNDYATILELLRDEGTLINWPARDPAKERPDAAEKRLVTLLFKLNGWPEDCKGGCPAERPIPKGTAVRIPDIPVEKIVTASDVPLGPKTVREHLLERLAPEHLSQVNSDYLLKLNRNRLQSLEAELSRVNLIPVSNPATALKPGTIVQFEAGREVPVGHLSQCSAVMGERITEKEVLTQASLSSSPTAASLPRSESPEAGGALDAKLRSLKEVVISFENVTEESIGRSDLNAALESGAENEQCSRLLSTPNAYVVTSARRAAAAKYRLIGKDGESKFLSEGELARLSLRGETDKTKEWSFVVSEPVYLGYALARVNPQTESLTWESVRQASAVKPASGFDVLAEKNRVLKLPATVWRLSLFVHAPDLKAGTSELSGVANAAGVDLLSEEMQGEGQTGYAAVLAARSQESGANAILQAEKEKIRENRRRLLEGIKYVPPVPQISSVVIGVGESDKSIHKDHPAYTDERGSAWYEKDGLALVPRARPLGGDAHPPPRLVKRFDQEVDHGDHVAGLIAARGDIAPGLAAGAGLYLIDNRTAATLGKSIDEALALAPSVEVFNFSFDIPGHAADKSQEELLKNMTEKWYTALFVVSAGNDGKNIGKMSERLPISWADRVPNIIGVAASNGDSLVGDTPPDPGSALTRLGSNFGEKYVHIAAPGRELFSVASENSYAAATGTSQAAPLVTAAAAMLYAQRVTAPPTIKARLIYTSDWVSQIETKVWGGLLNYRRAVWQPHENLLRLLSAPAAVSALKFRDGVLSVGEESDAFDARGEAIARPSTIRLSDILRIERVAGGTMRVVYLERHKTTRKVRILRNASLGGEVMCEKVQEWDEARGEFSQTGQCQRNFKAGEIFEYVAATPAGAISF